MQKRARRVYAKIQTILKRQEAHLHGDRDYQLTIRKSLATEVGQIGDLVGKGYVDMSRKGERYMYTDKLPPTSEHRFDRINVLPSINSKHRNTDMGFSLRKMTERDSNYLISPSNGALLGSEQKG